MKTTRWSAISNYLRTYTYMNSVELLSKLKYTGYMAYTQQQFFCKPPNSRLWVHPSHPQKDTLISYTILQSFRRSVFSQNQNYALILVTKFSDTLHMDLNAPSAITLLVHARVEYRAWGVEGKAARLASPRPALLQPVLATWKYTSRHR
jgi:hypothetical protein